MRPLGPRWVIVVSLLSALPVMAFFLLADLWTGSPYLECGSAVSPLAARYDCTSARIFVVIYGLVVSLLVAAASFGVLKLARWPWLCVVTRSKD